MQSIRFGHRTLVPSKVVCVGRNYVEHIEELGNEIPENMVIFNKPNSAISESFRYFGPETRFEGELSLLIEEGGITGIGFGFDLTHANIQNLLKAKGLPWERAKAFDGSAVFSPFVPFSGTFSELRFELLRNGISAQHADYRLMIYKPEEILEEIRSFMHLEDGDIIMTGTPKGVSTYNPGDRFTVTVFEGDRPLLKYSWQIEEG